MNRTVCGACKNHKDDNWVLCNDCQKKTVRRLSVIPKLHSVLNSDPWLKLPERVESERPARSATRGAPANLHVLSLLDKRTDVRSVLRPWVEEINERLEITTKPPLSVFGLCNRLTELMPWCASNHPAAADLVEEIKTQYVALDRVVTGARIPPKPVACPVILPDSGPCRGFLILHRDGAVSCQECKSVWPYESWQRLGALLAT